MNFLLRWKMVRFNILILIVVLSSCSLFEKDIYEDHPCVKEANKELTIEWGYYLRKSNDFYAFRLNTLGEISKVSKTKSENLMKIDYDKFCSLYSDINKEILKTQTLNVPRDTNVYVLIKNETLNYQFRALWDPKYETVGSEGFRAIWKSLNSNLPIDPNGKRTYFNFEFND